MEKAPNDFLAHRFLARAHAAGGRPGLAMRYEQVAARLPQYVGWLAFDPWLMEWHAVADTQRHLNNQLTIAAGKGDYERAARIAESLLERRPDDFNTLANLASCYRELGRLDEADATVSRALRLKPDAVDLHRSRAEIAFLGGDYAAADRALDAALEHDPADAGAFELRGRIRHLQGRHEEALAAAKRAIVLDPDASTPRLLLVAILRAAGRHREALAALYELLDRDPGNLRARRLLGEIGGGVTR